MKRTGAEIKVRCIYTKSLKLNLFGWLLTRSTLLAEIVSAKGAAHTAPFYTRIEWVCLNHMELWGMALVGYIQADRGRGKGKSPKITLPLCVSITRFRVQFGINLR